LLWFSFAVPAVALVLIFLPTHGMSPALRWTLHVSGMFLFFVGYTFYGIPYWSLTDDYSRDDARERRLLSTMLGAGLLVATALVALVSPGLIGAYGYRSAAVLFTLPGALLMIMPFFAQPREGARTHQEDGGPKVSLARQLLQALEHRRFLAVLLIFSGSQMAFTVITVSAPFIAIRLLGGTDADVATIMAPFLGTAIPFFAFAPMLSKRFGWERVVVVASIALAAVYAAAGGLGQAWVGTKMTTAMLLFGLGGPMAAVILGLEAEAITGCARETGREVTSLYFGVYNFMVKGLNGLATFLTGLLVSLANNTSIGTVAIRAMAFMAGALIVAGVIGYVAARPRTAQEPNGEAA
jgi:Na+/melibiose symporter-like transporter